MHRRHAARLHAILANCREEHPRILPPRYFGALYGDEGGIGAGTAFRVEMRVFGTTRIGRATVTEPEPGRVLAETFPDDGFYTTFTVEPVPDGAAERRAGG